MCTDPDPSKKINKKLNFCCILTSKWLLSLNTDANVPTENNKQKKLRKNLFFCWHLGSHWRKEHNLDPYYQNKNLIHFGKESVHENFNNFTFFLKARIGKKQNFPDLNSQKFPGFRRTRESIIYPPNGTHIFRPVLFRSCHWRRDSCFGCLGPNVGILCQRRWIKPDPTRPDTIRVSYKWHIIPYFTIIFRKKHSGTINTCCRMSMVALFLEIGTSSQLKVQSMSS